MQNSDRYVKAIIFVIRDIAKYFIDNFTVCMCVCPRALLFPIMFIFFANVIKKTAIP